MADGDGMYDFNYGNTGGPSRSYAGDVGSYLDGHQDYSGSTPNGNSPYYGTAMPSGDPSTDTGGGGFLGGLGNLFGTIGNNAANWLTSGLSNPELIPSLGAAWQAYQNAHTYQNKAEDYATKLNPFGEQRQQYQDMLSKAYTDPTGVLNDPGHQAEQKMQMDNLQRQIGARGGSTSNQQIALADYMSKSDAQYLAQERAGLANLAGAQFGPGAAEDMLKTGLLGSINSKNQALNSLMYPFGQGNKSTQPPITINNNNNSQGGAGGAGGDANAQGGSNSAGVPDISNAHLPVDRILQSIQNSGMNPRDAATLFRTIMGSPVGLDPSTLNILNGAGIPTGVDQGGMDHAGFGQGGFGGDNPVDPSTQGILDDLYRTPDGGTIWGGDSSIVGGGAGGGYFDPITSGFNNTGGGGGFGPIDLWGGGGGGGNFNFDTPDFSDFDQSAFSDWGWD